MTPTWEIGFWSKNSVTNFSSTWGKWNVNVSDGILKCNCKGLLSTCKWFCLASSLSRSCTWTRPPPQTCVSSGKGSSLRQTYYFTTSPCTYSLRDSYHTKANGTWPFKQPGVEGPLYYNCWLSAAHRHHTHFLLFALYASSSYVACKLPSSSSLMLSLKALHVRKAKDS